jgi:hypothetical protein
VAGAATVLPKDPLSKVLTRRPDRCRVLGMDTLTVPNTPEAQGLLLSARQWADVAISEALGSVRSRGVVRRHHEAEACRAARLSARYAIRLLGLGSGAVLVSAEDNARLEGFADAEELIAGMLERMAKASPVTQAALLGAALAVRLGQHRDEPEVRP